MGSSGSHIISMRFIAGGDGTFFSTRTWSGRAFSFSDEYPPEIYLDLTYGNDLNPGTVARPIKTIARLLTMVSPGCMIYFIDTQIGQPDYLYRIADSIYWDLEPPAYIETIFRAYQYIVLAQAELASIDTQRNYYLKIAQNLQRFSSLFPIYSRGDSFEVFRRRLLDIWFGYQEPSTIQGLNRIAGAYTGQPLFVHRYLDDPDVWILNVSYLDQHPPENYIIGTAWQAYGAIFEVFGWWRISAEVDAEFDKIFKENASLSPYGVIKHQQDQPAGFLLIKDGYHDFDLMILDNMEYRSGSGAEVWIIDPSIPASLETYPVPVIDAAYYGYLTGLKLALFERLYSDSIVRKIYYAWGPTESGPFGDWVELPYVWTMAIQIEDNYIKFKIEVSDSGAEGNYALVSIMLKGT